MNRSIDHGQGGMVCDESIDSVAASKHVPTPPKAFSKFIVTRAGAEQQIASDSQTADKLLANSSESEGILDVFHDMDSYDKVEDVG
jgi:hypothetical protein